MNKASLPARIERSIGERILGGEFPPGTLLPNEADWGRTYGASRTAVREAIKSLTAKGLIRSRPKIGSRVQPRSQWNLLDREVLDWHRSAMDRRSFLLATQEARRLIEPGIAELAARKHSPDQLGRLMTALKAMKSAKKMPDVISADVAYHEALLACANNELLVPFGIIIEQALNQLFDFTTSRNPHYAKALKLHEAIVHAVAAADPAAARLAMNTLLKDTDAVIARSATKVPGKTTRRRPLSTR